MTSRLRFQFLGGVVDRFKFYVIAIIFVIYLIAQHWLIFPYHDDWGLAVLDYVGEVQGFTGQNFKIHHVIEFLEGMYLHWSGRVMAFFVQIYLFKLGLEYVRIFQVAIILLIIWLSLRINSINTINHNLIILPIVLYLALPIFSLTDGLYWFSAASAYTWGIPFMLAGAWRLKYVAGPSILACLLLGVAATFHEQMAVSVFMFYSVYVFLEYLDNKKSKRVWNYIAYSLPLLLGVMFNLFAPGNFARLNNPTSVYPEGGILQLIFKNLDALSNYLVIQPSGNVYLVFWVISFLVLMVRCFFYCEESSRKIGHYFLFPIVLIALYFYSALVFLVFFVLLYGLLLYFLRKNNVYGNGVVALYAGAIANFSVLLMAPGVPGRSLQSFYLIMFVIIVNAFCFDKKRVQNYLVVLVLILSPFALQNGIKIFQGYYLNYEVNVINHTKLVVAHYDHTRDDSFSQPLILYKLPNPTFAGTMPYDRPLIEKWIKKFYGIPANIAFVWK